MASTVQPWLDLVQPCTRWAIFSSLLVACSAPLQQAPGVQETPKNGPVESPEELAEPQGSRPPALAQGPSPDLVVLRSALLKVLERGPGAFLATVQVKPTFAKRRFAGWQVVLHPFGELDLRLGDIVQSVNQRTIERPEQLAELWAELHSAQELTIAGTRGGKAFTLTVPIVQSP